MRTAVAVIVCIIAGIATSRGIRSVLRKDWEPPAATWWIWVVNDAVILYFAWKTGSKPVELALLTTFTLGALTFAMLSVWYGTRGLVTFDYICLIGAGVSLVAGKIVGNDLGLILSVTTNFIGSWPTYFRVIPNPRSEDRAMWTIFAAGALINLLTIHPWTWQVAIFPLYSVTGCTSVAYFTTRKVGKKGDLVAKL